MFQVRAYEARTITWWYQKRADIEFAPPFQRSGKLWSVSDKAYLVDSILNEYDFPKLYLADFSYTGSTLNISKKKFAVIDGRQRLEAIFDFIENRFPLSQDFVLEGQLGVDLRGLFYSDLRAQQPSIALLFEQFNLPVMSVITDDPAKINQLFVRMNRNKPLTGAEIRNAMQGAVPPAIRTIAGHIFFTDRCSFATQRGQDKNVAAKLLLLSHANQFVNTKKTDLDTFVKRFVDSFEASASQASALSASTDRALKVLDEMAKEFGTNDPRLKASGLIPVYFRVVEEHGAAQFSEFLSFWNAYSMAEDSILSEVDYVDEIFKGRIRLFQLIKRNPNDSYALQRLFAVLSLEFQRFKLGTFKDGMENVSRLRNRIRAIKQNARKERTQRVKRSASSR